MTGHTDFEQVTESLDVFITTYKPPPTGVDLRNLNQPMSSLANNILPDLNTFETSLTLSYYHTQGHRHHSPTVSADLIGRNASKTEAAIAFYQSDAMHELNMLISVWFAAIDPEAWFLYRAAYKAFVGGSLADLGCKL